MLRHSPVALAALLVLVRPDVGLAQEQPADVVEENRDADAELPEAVVQDVEPASTDAEEPGAELIGIPEIVADNPAEDGVRLGGFVFLEATRLNARSTDVNPGNLFGLSANTFEAAVVVEGTTSGFTWRARGESIGSGDRFPKRTRVRLKELSYQRRIGQRWSISVGKQERSWDAGVAFRPLGFFRTQPNLSDPFDSEGRQEGLPLISVIYVGDAFIAEAVVSDDVFGDIDDDIEARQWAARVSRQFGKIDASLVVRQAAGQSPGVGGSVSYSAGAVELHADAYVGPHGRQRAHRALSGSDRVVPNGEISDDLFTSDPFILDRGGRGTVVNGVVGVTWAPSSDLSLRAEYVHRGGGLSGRKWSSYLDLVAGHRASLDTSSRSLAITNLSYDIGVLRGSVRKDYLYVQGSVTLGKLSLSASTIAGLADGSATLIASATHRFGQRAAAVFSAVGFIGSRMSEYGLLPFGTIVSLSLRRSF